MPNTYTKLLAISVFLLSLLPLAVSAHTLKTDGTIGAVMHTDPDDNPIAARPATIYFEFKDTNNYFSSSTYVSVLTISQNNQTLATTTLAVDATNNAQYPFTFPDVGNYTIQVVGTPKNLQKAPPFTLTYTTTAITGSANVGFWAEHGFHIVVFGIGFGVAIYFLIRGKMKAKKEAQ